MSDHRPSDALARPTMMSDETAKSHAAAQEGTLDAELLLRLSAQWLLTKFDAAQHLDHLSAHGANPFAETITDDPAEVARTAVAAQHDLWRDKPVARRGGASLAEVKQRSPDGDRGPTQLTLT
jgi:hypothetical protein